MNIAQIKKDIKQLEAQKVAMEKQADRARVKAQYVDLLQRTIIIVTFLLFLFFVIGLVRVF